MKTFNEAFELFFNGVVKIRDDYKAANFPNNPEEALTYKKGKRYMKLIVCNSIGEHSSVFCFVDRETGNVLKAAGWSAPAKGARGNIFNEDNGLGRMTPYGAAYNRG